MKLREYTQYLGWSIGDLARHSKINDRTAAKALKGGACRTWVVQRIAAALSIALDMKVMPGDIEDLQIDRQGRKKQNGR